MGFLENFLTKQEAKATNQVLGLLSILHPELSPRPDRRRGQWCLWRRNDLIRDRRRSAFQI